MKTIPAQFREALGVHSPLRTAMGHVRKLMENLDSALNMRAVTAEEIRQLQQQGNRADDWGKILVASGFDPGRVHGNRFVGPCVLGRMDGMPLPICDDFALTPGVENSLLENVWIGDNVLIRDCGVVRNAYVGPAAIIMGCGIVRGQAGCSFGNGQAVSAGLESGGREVPIAAEIPFTLAARLAEERNNRALQQDWARLAEEYASACTLDWTVLEQGARVLFTPTVAGCYLGPGVHVENALALRESCLLSDVSQPCLVGDGALVEHSCLQWGSRVESGAIVQHSLLCEASGAERQAKVTDSIIGPNSIVAEGEVTASFVGPFTGFHHQALLIAAVWSEGKGNVGYGANVGSNHTGKAPDQEIVCGEGLFFGLGVNVKFPADYSAAAYSIIATGVDTLPQRVDFPFSLINRPHQNAPGIPPAYNELFPAWVLLNNLYAVRRNQAKYRQRNRAQRSQLDLDVFRPHLVRQMQEARRRLQAVANPREVYTEEQIPGLGKNFLREPGRQQGIEGYGLAIEHVLLRALWGEVEHLAQTGQTVFADLYSVASSRQEWEQWRPLFLEEHMDQHTVGENLQRLILLEEQAANRIQAAKQRDDVRGRRIIPDYDAVHVSAEDDPFIREVRAETELTMANIRALLARISS